MTALRAPASHLQAHYVNDALDGRSNVNLAVCLRFSGALDVAALRAALAALATRHEALRTTFARAGTDVVQLIQPAGQLALELIDLRDRGPLPDAALRAHVAALADREADVERGALACAALVALGVRDHVLALVVHHAVSDGWSCDVLAHELRALYVAHALGEPPPLAPLERQQRDHARAERAVADRAAEAYWRELLGRPRGGLDLPIAAGPADVPQPFRVEPAGTLAPEMMDALRALARGRGAGTTTMALLALAAAALAPHARGELTLSVLHANRGEDPAFDGVVGLLADFVPLRIELAGRPSFATLLERVRDAWLDGLGYRLPLCAVLRALPPTPRPPFDLTVNVMPYVALPTQPLPASLALAIEPLIVPLSDRRIRMRSLAGSSLPFELNAAEDGERRLWVRTARLGELVPRPVAQAFGTAVLALAPRVLAQPERPVVELHA